MEKPIKISGLVQGALLFSIIGTGINLYNLDGLSYIFSLAGIIDLIFSTVLGTALIVGIVRLFQWVIRKIRK
jgi:hypothetical protein